MKIHRLFGCVAVLLFTSQMAYGFSGEDIDRPKLTVRGHAVVQKPADEMTMTIGVITENQDSREALRNNSEIMQEVIENLVRVGLTNNDYKTGRFSIRPTYTHPPKDPLPDWKTTINGYEVTNSIVVKTGKLHLAGKIIDSANSAGANSIDNIRFRLKDPRMHRSEAIEAATANAIEDASSLANAASLRLVRVLDIALDAADSHTIPSEPKFLAARADIAPPIDVGDVDVSATVTMIYEIGPQ